MNEERNTTDRFVIAYNSLLEEVKQLRARRVAMLNIIEKQREEIYELKKRLEENDG